MNVSFRFLIVILGCLLLFSCGEPRVIKEIDPIFPSDSLIPREKMIRLLVDIHIVEAALVAKRNDGVASNDLAIQYYQAVFKKYGISRNRYDKNLKFYRQDPEEFGKMYEEVVRELTNLQKIYPQGK
ncbi:MAG: DUF4296 domain-containing protein [Bacteroidales bacterium]|jgi:hypothetical protein|nr:DUF4296 domain-containing protein [Bacteroidales bacterium]